MARGNPRGTNPTEDRLIRDIEHRTGSLGEEFEQIIRPYRDDALNEKDFTNNPYTADDIKKDRDIVEDFKRRKEYSEYRSPQSYIFEYGLIHGMLNARLAWFGKDVQRAVKTAESDDFQNGVDIVVSFEDDQGKLVNLGIDVTTREEERAVRSKLTRLRDRADNHDLTRVKYFEDIDQHHGEVQMPVIVLGLTEGDADLMREQMIKAKQYSGAREALAKSPQMFRFLDSAEIELSFFLERALTEEGQAPTGAVTTERLIEHAQAVRAKTANKKLAEYIDAHVAVIKIVSKTRKEKDPLRKASGVNIGPEPGRPFTYLADRQNLGRLTD